MTQNQTVYQPRAFPVADAPSRIAVCISGSGTTLANLLQKMDEGKLPGIEIVCVIADRPQATGLEVAGQRGISTHVISRKDENMSQHIFDIVRHAKADLVVLGGFLSLLFVPDDYENRVINIHPSLIPAFCGRGFYGKAVHQAAVEAGVRFSGCTVHFADRSYDTGPIIIQKVVPVLDSDTPENLAQRVFQQECDALPEAIQLVVSGRVNRIGRRTVILES